MSPKLAVTRRQRVQLDEQTSIPATIKPPNLRRLQASGGALLPIPSRIPRCSIPGSGYSIASTTQALEAPSLFRSFVTPSDPQPRLLSVPSKYCVIISRTLLFFPSLSFRILSPSLFRLYDCHILLYKACKNDTVLSKWQWHQENGTTRVRFQHP